MRMQTNYYGDGRKEHVTDDGRKWREATQAQLVRLAPDALVFLMGSSEPKPRSHFDGYCLAGGYPLLPGLAALFPVYVEA